MQAGAWPALLSGRDALILAPPGSGKTLAYLLPLLSLAAAAAAAAVRGAKDLAAPQVVVIAPTRELAQQVSAAATAAAAGAARSTPTAPRVHIVCLSGGADVKGQVRALKAATTAGGALVAVGTPGRLLELAEPTAEVGRGSSAGASAGDEEPQLSLRECVAAVLDEADRLLAKGLGPQMARLRALLPPRVQVGAVSATWDEAAEASWGWQLHRPLRIEAERGSSGRPPFSPEAGDEGEDVGDRPAWSVVPPTITQRIEVCAEHKKPRKLMKKLADVAAADTAAQRRQKTRVLVFANKISTVTFLTEFLRRYGREAAAEIGTWGILRSKY